MVILQEANRLEVFEIEVLIETLVFASGFVRFELVNVLEVMVEDCMDLCWSSSMFVAIKDRLSQCDCLGQLRLGEFFILLHLWPNFFEISIEEVIDDFVLVFVDFVCVEILVVTQEVLDLIVFSKV